MNLSSATVPIVNPLTDVVFSPEERSIIIEFNDIDLLNAITEIDYLHNSFLPNIEEYSKRRDILTDSMSIEGYKQTVALLDSRKLNMVQRLQINELDELLQEMFRISEIDLHDVGFALRALVIQMKRHVRVKIDLHFPQNRPVSSATRPPPSSPG